MPLRTLLLPVLAMGLISALPADAQQRPGGPGSMGMMAPDPLEVALEEASTLELTDAQRTRLTRFHTESAERAGPAREKVREAMQRRMAEGGRQGQDRGQAGQRGRQGQAGPRGQGGGPGQMDPQVREAMETVRAEREMAMAELRATLTADQFQRLQRMMEARRPGPR
jgi:hypothetical protein